MSLFEDVRVLCELPGVSGREGPVRDYLISRLPAGVSYDIDAMGNLYVEKQGAARPKNKVVLFAHMDEVGLMITYITEEGYLKFDEIGGIDPAVLIGRTVKLECGLTGVIALKAIHLCEGEEARKIPEMRELYIDIGAKDKADAEQYVELGSFATYVSDYVEFGKSLVKMKALDDRFGCALMLDLLHQDLPYDTTFVFTVQEEVGARGAAAAAFRTEPDIAVILETTTAGDICGVEGERRACVLGEGPVVSYMDRGTVYDYHLYSLAMETAKEAGIPAQTKTLVAGGNDSSSVQRAGAGSRVLAISAPTRYLHSPVDVLDKEDVLSMQKLLSVLLPKLAEQ
ncbi:MAG: M42 family peptidase [Clostridia bacterium]|nr:M42 family peptidase [Clostridia bacterium]MBQ8470103.1 M42 family peptidase [Clostridia bacterium]